MCLITLVICNVLLFETTLPSLSITSVNTYMSKWHTRYHIFFAGLMPVYVAAVFFGATMVGSLIANYCKNIALKIIDRE